MKKTLLMCVCFAVLPVLAIYQQPNPERKLDFPLDVASFNYPSMTVVDVFGYSGVIEEGTNSVDIWEFGGAYPYDATNTAPIAYISSSSTNNAQPVKIDGLDSNGWSVVQTVTLNGQNNVALTTPLWRVFCVENVAGEDDGGNFAGTVYVHTNATVTAGVPPDASVRAIVVDGNNRSLIANYTIPRGKVGFLYFGEVAIQYVGLSSASVGIAHVHYESRRYGKVFTIKKSVTVISTGTGVYQTQRTFPDIIPALTDIRIQCEEANEDMGLSAAMVFLLVDEDQFPPSLLETIGQPFAGQ